MPTVQPSVLDLARRAHAAGALAQAEQLFRQALAASPKDVSIARALAGTLRQLRRSPEAAQVLSHAIAQMPGNPVLHTEFAQAMLDVNCLPEAAAALGKAIQLAPRTQALYPMLAEVYERMDELLAAVDTLKKGLELFPANVDFEARLGRLYNEATAHDLCIAHLSRVIDRLPPGEQRAQLEATLGASLGFEERYEEALARLRAARAASDTTLWAVNEEALILEQLGRAEEARALLASLVSRLGPRPEFAAVRARFAEREKDFAGAAAILEEVLRTQQVSPQGASKLTMQLGGIYEKLERYDDAWAMILRGKRIHEKAFDPAAHRARIDAIVSCFAPGKCKGLARAAQTSELPLFIVGMMRSGTSLCEQILSCLPGLYGAGELTAMSLAAHNLARQGNAVQGCVGAAVKPKHLDAQADAYLAEVRTRAARGAPGRVIERVTDKMPQNFMYVGLMGLMFPGARFIHTTRDPVDICLSCFTTPFSRAFPWLGSLESLGEYYLQYHRLMQHWHRVAEELGIRVFDLPYEQLTADQEAWSRRLVDFVGLPWEDACLKFHESDRRTKTASVDQVKRPMYRTSVSRAKKFGAHLDPLRRVLAPILPESERAG